MKYLYAWMGCLLCASLAAAQDMPLSQVLIDGEGWKPFAKGFQSIDGLAADRLGKVYVSDGKARRVFIVEEGGKSKPLLDTGAVPGGLVFSTADSQVYVSLPAKPGLCSLGQGAIEAHLPAAARDLAVARNGNVYFTAPDEKAVYLFRPKEKPQRVAEGLTKPTGIVLWPDSGTLVVADAVSKHLQTYRVEKDGSLTCKDGYYTLRLPNGKKESGAAGMTMDSAGRLYVATTVGVQCFDPTGRLNGVLLNPTAAPSTAVAFGGTDGNLLYVACGDQVFVRKTKAKGTAFPEKAKN